MGHRVSAMPSSSHEYHPQTCCLSESSEMEMGGTTTGPSSSPSRRRHRRHRLKHQDSHNYNYNHNHSPSSSSSSSLSQLTLIMIAVASAAKVAAGTSSLSGPGSCGPCCFVSAARPASLSATSLSASSLSVLPPLSTLLAPLASMAHFTGKSSHRTPSSSSSASSSSTSSPSATSSSSDVSSYLAAAVVPPPNSRLARLKNRNRGRTSGTSRTDLRYANDGGDGDGMVEGGYAPYERWVRSTSSSSSSRRRTLFASGDSSDTDFESFLSLDESPSNATDPMNRPSRVRSNRIGGGKRARMARFVNSRFSRRRRHPPSNHHHDALAPSSLSSSDQPPSSSSSEEDYQKRKAAWAAKYTSVATLRSAFGTNKNRLWGDFDPKTTRRLYHALLPRALLGLRDMGLSDVDELAPLAYQARVAAKKYARERSMLPGRIGSMLYDGFRQWRRYGKFDHRGMTWEQVWRKYEDQVLREAVEELNEEESAQNDGDEADDVAALRRVRSAEKALLEYADALDDEELTTRICLRILERSVVTNEAIDKLFLKRIMNGEEGDDDDEDNDDDEDDCVSGDITTRRQRKLMRRQRRKLRIQADLKAIEKKFDDDIRELLLHGVAGANGGDDNSHREDDEAKASIGRRRKRKFFFSRKSPRDRLSEEGDPSPANAGESTASLARGGATSSPSSFRDRDEIDTLQDSSSDIAAVILSMSDFEYHRAKDFAAHPTAVDRGGVASASYARDSLSVADEISGGIGNDKKKETRRLRKLAVHEVFALRILASTKQRIASLHSLSNGSSDSRKEYGKVVAINNDDEDEDGDDGDRQ